MGADGDLPLRRINRRTLHNRKGDDLEPFNLATQRRNPVAQRRFRPLAAAAARRGVAGTMNRLGPAAAGVRSTCGFALRVDADGVALAFTSKAGPQPQPADDVQVLT